MANPTPTPTSEQKIMSLPSEAQVRESFQKQVYICPVPNDQGGLVPKHSHDGPIYPSWANYKATLREPSPVRHASEIEIRTYNSIIKSSGEPAARQWLNREWS